MKKIKPAPHHTTDHRSKLQRLRAFVNQHHLATTVVCGIALILISGSITYFLLHKKPNYRNMPLSVKKQAPKKYYSPLTGLPVANQAATTQPVTAVMIENSPSARPQSGLKKAGVVYEAVAEGGITRFLAVYQHDKPALIGPVRSLRLYYLSWGAQYQASIAHVGGSPNALAEVRNGNYRDIDQFFNAGSYWRANDRRAPHNMYTSGERLDQLNAAKGYKESVFQSFTRQDPKPVTPESTKKQTKQPAAPTANQITINLSSNLYNTSYVYDKAANTYVRAMAGAPHTDREEGQIAPHVVVVLEAPIERRAGTADAYEDVVTTGTGKAHVFQNGTVVEATWRKEGMSQPLTLVDAANKPVALNRGQTWIATITPGRGGVSWQ